MMAKGLQQYGFVECKDRGNKDLCRLLWPTVSRSTPGGSATAKGLRCLLKKSEVDIPLSTGCIDYVPLDKLGEIINESTMLELLGNLWSCRNWSRQDKVNLAREICGREDSDSFSSFRRVVAALIRIRKAEDIPLFIHQEVTDDWLPLVKVPHSDRYSEDPYILKHYETGHVCTAFRQWTSEERRKFLKISEKYLAPFFVQPRHGVNHYILHKATILPFTYIRVQNNEGDQGSDDPDTSGGFGEVRCVEIHPSHYRFDSIDTSGEQLFAIKKLNTKVRKDFEDEVSPLLRFAHRPEKQLVKLLATFELREGNDVTYFLIFPWADGSVRAHWRNNPRTKDPGSILWIAREAVAIAESLAFLHLDYARELDSTEREKFGRHGDLKAGNLLVYEHSAQKQIFISDFGLSRFHRQHSRSMVQPRATSPSYRPPEFDLPQATLSRKSDMWSLGAFFLEFATWYLEGWDSVKTAFPVAREEVDHQNITSDIFFHLDGNCAIVKPQVFNWVRRLHQNQKCTQYIHELLNLVMNRMMLADRDLRLDASELWDELSAMYWKCRQNMRYYNAPCPHPRDPA
ncbi:uncharacterized protein JN550_001503 [Neoarthrinium moseri]|uniref:uncharacterized protein n=1 Tax=Neoarthrinium moseri TaxID=1658444 RepID=UPI001FDE7CF6|nr:uncharacterized protein JN550_001503 [Neoarthrinium moseri]KAI1876007.1 hypothetical protein JN550_001503 [Neoarthrinium moseri]